MFDFKGKRVVVCGGSRGIGRAVALGFAAAGAGVSVCARNPGPLQDTFNEIVGHGVAAHATNCDLADGTAVLAYVEEAAKALGGIDVLVNNASGFGSTDTEEGWNAGLSVDVMATVAPAAPRCRTWRHLWGAQGDASSTSPRSPASWPAAARRPTPR